MILGYTYPKPPFQHSSGIYSLTMRKIHKVFLNMIFSIFNSGCVVNSTGYIPFRRELMSSIECFMDLKSFLHDIQHCQMEFESYIYGISVVNFTTNFCVKVNLVISFYLIKILIFELYSISSLLSKDTEHAPAVVKIVLKRKLAFYLYQLYFKLILLAFGIQSYILKPI